MLHSDDSCTRHSRCSPPTSSRKRAKWSKHFERGKARARVTRTCARVTRIRARVTRTRARVTRIRARVTRTRHFGSLPLFVAFPRIAPPMQQPFPTVPPRCTSAVPQGQLHSGARRKAWTNPTEMMRRTVAYTQVVSFRWLCRFGRLCRDLVTVVGDTWYLARRRATLHRARTALGIGRAEQGSMEGFIVHFGLRASF
jgi:hypothetical protein